MRTRADVLERGLLIGGKSVPASSGKLADDVCPRDGEIYARVAAGTPADITRAADAAQAAFPGWSAMGAFERREIFLRAADVMANDTDYGLTGGVISRDLTAALDVAARVRTGIIHINDQGIADEPMAPFGGIRNSGYGKFGGTVGTASFTEQRWITIQHNGRPAYPF
jgi:acyl-CoA reductase-like NAD-dependent aldehyde dehydrogenase